MKKLWFATTNPGKVSSLQRVLVPYGVEVAQIKLEIPEVQTLDIRVIAGQKVRYAYDQLKEPVVAQDSGFFLTAWNGFPGPFVKFAFETLGVEGILTLMKDKGRECEIRECLAYQDANDDSLVFFEETVLGSLSCESRGYLTDDSWSSLWLVFIPEGETKTLAEMTSRELARWRKNRKLGSLAQFAKWYAEEKAGIQN